MYVRIRRENSPGELIYNCSKNTVISDLIEFIKIKWGCPKYRQLLFYQGAQLSYFSRLIEYKIRHNDVIVFIEKKYPQLTICRNLLNTTSEVYKVGDLVEVRCKHYCVWWPAQISGIMKHRDTRRLDGMHVKTYERKLTFIVRYAQATEDDRFYLTEFDCIRFSKGTVPYENLKQNDIIIIKSPLFKIFDNMGIEMQIRGLLRRQEIILADIVFGKTTREATRLLRFSYNDLTPNIQKLERCARARRIPRDVCRLCMYNILLKCDCFICRDVIPMAYPEGYNPRGTNDLRYRAFVTEVNTPEPTVSAALKKKPGYHKNASSKSWGAGASCWGRLRVCEVPKNHRGPIPGVDVGTRWKFRTQVSEAGVHRPLISGVHGGGKEAAYSLIISGSYEEDYDFGHEFLYTGSGGRNFGNQRVVAQTRDQELVRTNRALALSCWAPLSVNGSTSENWKKGIPIRVCRSYKQAEYSVYAPKDGIRYDGIYKVVKYYREKGASGYIEWKFLLRRDDPNPAPWEDDGEEQDIIYPDGYLAAIEQKEVKGKKRKALKERDPSIKPRATRLQTKLAAEKQEFPVLGPTEKGKGKSTKKSFKLDPEIQRLIEFDERNATVWEQCAEVIKLGKMRYIAKVKEEFSCILCLETVYDPVTTECKHNTCLNCLLRSFEVNIYECPYCKMNLGEDYIMQVNENLGTILEKLMPGYAQYR